MILEGASSAAAGRQLEPEPFRPYTYLAHHAARRPEAPAVYEAGRTIGFAELERRVRALMSMLASSGVRPGEVVAVSLPNVWEYVALEVAVPAVGAVVMPLAPALGAYEVRHALERSGAVLLVGETALGSPPAAGGARSAVRSVLSREEVAAAAARLEPDPVALYPSGAEDAAQIALTSGTTGPPKLATLSARLKQLTFEGYTARLRIGPEDRVLPLSPVTQGVGEMSLYALRRGACLVMTGEPRFDPERALRLAASSGASVLGGVPTMISRLVHCPLSVELPALRLTAVAGAPLPPEVAEAWERRSGAPVVSFYGAMDLGQLAVGSPDDPAEKRWHSVGRPHETAEMLICDPAGRPVAAGEVGEVCMRGPLVQDRYWGEEAGPCAPDGWAHFGDLGFLDAEGFLHVVGRTKDIVIRGGNNISPFEVESHLAEHPSVAEACLVAAPDPDLGELPVAFVVARPGCRPSLLELRAHLEARGLARYKWPERLVLLDELPLGASGKVARSALRELAAKEVG